MKRNYSNCGPCFSLIGSCLKEWRNSGKILVSYFAGWNFILFARRSTSWRRKNTCSLKHWWCRFSRRRSQNWFSRDGNSGTTKSHVGIHIFWNRDSYWCQFALNLIIIMIQLFRFFAKQFGTAAKHILSHSHHPKFGWERCWCEHHEGCLTVEILIILVVVKRVKVTPHIMITGSLRIEKRAHFAEKMHRF